MFIVKLTYNKSLATIDQLRPAHLDFLDKYYAQEVFIASGRQDPAIGGVIIARGVSKSELIEILHQDPFYLEKVADYEVTEFSPNKFHPAIKDLI